MRASLHFLVVVVFLVLPTAFAENSVQTGIQPTAEAVQSDSTLAPVPAAETITLHKVWFFALAAALVIMLAIITSTLYLIHRLKSAKSTAQGTAELKSLFIANMSHELRTPLNAIIGMTDLIMATDLEPQQLEYANVIRVSGDTLLDVISEILDFSKIEAGNLQLEENDFDLLKCIEDTLDVVVAKATEKNVELVYEIDSKVPAIIRGDAARLRQILLNLLSNSVRYTADGEISINVTATQEADSHEINFAVHDTGSGIESLKLKQIFNGFTQAGVAATKQSSGTGLGLSISHHLSELMGGTMWAESTPGKGSTFFFTIKTPATSQVRAVFAEQTPFKISNPNVLIVDDNETNLRILSAQLTRWGLKPVVFDNPQNALDSIAKGNEYALMISDMHMPKMDGSALVREVRTYRNMRELPVIILTSLGYEPTDNSLGIAKGLIKPVKPAQLYQNIATILEDEKAADAVTLNTDCKPGNGDSLNILVVEDNRLNQKVALRMFDKLGYSADLACDGIEAVDMVKQKKYDLIFMDIQMPRLDGLSATRIILEDATNGRPYIVAMTAHAAKEDRDLGIAAGMDDYLTKPIQLVKLQEMITRVQTPARAGSLQT